MKPVRYKPVKRAKIHRARKQILFPECFELESDKLVRAFWEANFRQAIATATEWAKK